MITEPEVSLSAKRLQFEWQKNWQTLNKSEASAIDVVTAIDGARDEVRTLLSKLE